MRGSGGPLLCIGDLVSDVGEEHRDEQVAEDHDGQDEADQVAPAHRDTRRSSAPTSSRTRAKKTSVRARNATSGMPPGNPAARRPGGVLTRS